MNVELLQVVVGVGVFVVVMLLVDAVFEWLRGGGPPGPPSFGGA